MDAKEIEQLRGMDFGLETMKWHGWGSPVGLGLFFLAVAGTIWILAQAFNWG